MSFICHIHNYTEYNQQWNVFSAFKPSKCTHLEQRTHTHTWSSEHTHTQTHLEQWTHTHLEQWTHTHTNTPGAVNTHTPGAVGSRGFGALLKGLTSVVDNSCRSRDSNPQPRVTSPTLYPLEPRLPHTIILSRHYASNHRWKAVIRWWCCLQTLVWKKKKTLNC